MSISEITQSARFIIGKDGNPSDVVLNIETWKTMISILEHIEYTDIVAERMRNWRTKEGWTSWDEFEAEEDELSPVD